MAKLISKTGAGWLLLLPVLACLGCAVLPLMSVPAMIGLFGMNVVSAAGVVAALVGLGVLYKTLAGRGGSRRTGCAHACSVDLRERDMTTHDKDGPVSCVDETNTPSTTELMSQIMRDFYIAHHIKADGLELRLHRDGRDAARALIAHERQCCSHLRFDLIESGDELILSVTAADIADRESLYSVLEPFLPGGVKA